MRSFLITFKPATENRHQGWPLEKLLKLHRIHTEGREAIENWRFHNRREVVARDRVFLLRQGKQGIAILGYGTALGPAQMDGDRWYVPILFEALVDPTTEVLATKAELLAIDAGPIWRTQASGVRLPEQTAEALEALVVGRTPTLQGLSSTSNPDWTRDELIVALSFYLAHRSKPPMKASLEIAELSNSLNRLGAKLFSAEQRATTFRNENGVYMKLMNFRRLDPVHTGRGRTGLARGASADEAVWLEFANDPAHCHLLAKAILSTLENDFRGQVAEFNCDLEVEEAAEGRLLTRLHIFRERNRALVENKKRQALRTKGKLECEVCGFDFEVCYGERGSGFIECHHTKAISSLCEGDKTHIDDLAIVCANCHRMLHRGKRWLSIGELREMLKKVAFLAASTSR